MGSLHLLICSSQNKTIASKFLSKTLTAKCRDSQRTPRIGRKDRTSILFTLANSASEAVLTEEV